MWKERWAKERGGKCKRGASRKKNSQLLPYFLSLSISVSHSLLSPSDPCIIKTSRGVFRAWGCTETVTSTMRRCSCFGEERLDLYFLRSLSFCSFYFPSRTTCNEVNETWMGLCRGGKDEEGRHAGREPGPGRWRERQRGQFKVGQLRCDKQENTQIPLK